jgi:hypothetical protein
MQLISEDLFKLKFIVLKQVETQVAIFVYVIIRDAFVVLAADVLLLLKKDPAAGDQKNEQSLNVPRRLRFVETRAEGVVNY